MDEVVAYCGLTCQHCPIYLATREKDKEKREKMKVDIARICKEQYGMELSPEDITDCDGCKTAGGRLFSGCMKCEIRKCARQKGLENCAHCSEYPCEQLNKFFATDPSAKTRLDIIKDEL
jgi:hypothetical protein